MKGVNLTTEERKNLEAFTRTGKHNVREINRAYMLLWLDQGLTNATIESLLGMVYYTPKHGSWLNMTEIEINIMSNQCLGDKICNELTLNRQLNVWSEQRNQEKKKIYWTFTKQDAYKELPEY